MQWRIELKYYIKSEVFNSLLQDLEYFCDYDSHAVHTNAYDIHSIYFENFEHYSYHEKMQGLQDRFKLRVRYYNDNQTYSNIELKYKQANKIAKDKTKFNFNIINDLGVMPYSDFIGNYGEKLGNKIYKLIKLNNFIPYMKIS